MCTAEPPLVRWWTPLAGIVLLFATACVATPQPDPPSLDPDRLQGRPRSDRETDEDIVGLAGAVDPPGALLWISPIDRADLPARTIETAADGSFVLSLASGRYRLQPRLGAARGEVLDLTIVGGLLEIDRPALACLRLPVEVPVGNEAQVTITNECDQEVSILAASMRIAVDFDVLEVPARIAAGATAAIRVRRTGTRTDTSEEILRVDIDRPAAERRAVTLFTAGD